MSGMKFKTKNSIVDDNGFVQNFDGYRVYGEAAEDDPELEGGMNGYPCSSWDEAIAILIDGGYIEMEPIENLFKQCNLTRISQ